LLTSLLKSLNSKRSIILSGKNKTYTNVFVFTTASFHPIPISFVRDNEIHVSEVNRYKIASNTNPPQSVIRHQPLRFETSQQRNIRIARELYDDLCDISVLISSIYGFQILLELGVTTVEMTMSSYLMLATILEIHSVEANTKGRFSCVIAAWLLLYAFKLISITAPCQYATSEV
jgi:hypothetical protein